MSITDLSESFLSTRLIGCDADYSKSGTVVFGAPFDGTVTFRPGSRFAPSRIRSESFGLETYSPYLDRDLEDYAVHDAGDLDLPFGNTVKALGMISECAEKIVRDGKKPMMIGGEHLVTLPAFEAVLKKHPDLCLLHFDAHTDMREDYLGEKLSHATVMRRIWEHTEDGRIWQFGIRSGTREEFRWMEQGHVFLNRYDLSGVPAAVRALNGRPVYVTVDLDVFDPSVFPGTGTPEPGGVGFREFLDAAAYLKDLNIVGADVVELAPHYDASGASTAVACKVIRELLLCMV